jgi:hypothetical protein
MRLAFVPALLLAACASAPPHAFDDAIGRSDVVTLTNLHPDERRARLFATNYQQDGLIPVCSQVTLLERDEERLRFRVEATARVYEYYFHKAAAEPFPDHLARVFGAPCPRAQLDALPELDRRGVTEGKALVGMTKAGVGFALGLPPRHATPSLDASRWTYWTNRFNRIAVVFDATGRVSSVEN